MRKISRYLQDSQVAAAGDVIGVVQVISQHLRDLPPGGDGAPKPQNPWCLKILLKI